MWSPKRESLKLRIHRPCKSIHNPISFTTMESKNKKQDSKETKSKYHKVLMALAAVFFSIWILIGIFVLLLLADGFKRGAYQGLLGGQSQQEQPQAQVPEAPQEVDLPGIGKINVACAQEALTDESIQKIVTEGSTESLTAEEKTNFEKCIVAPPASPTPTS